MQRKLLTMKLHHPLTQALWYFIDKCLPFGSSKSCALFQAFSDALRHLAEWKLQVSLALDLPPAITNYLDDFLFIAITKLLCDGMITEFLSLCQSIGCPISVDKTEWGTTVIIFLGILLNGRSMTLSLPLKKRVKALNLLQQALSSKKVTVHFVQKLLGR